jgi:hypothetical protein
LIIEASLRDYHERWTAAMGPLKRTLWFAFRHVWVMSCVVAGYALFRSPTISDAAIIFSQVTDWTGVQTGTSIQLGLPQFELVVLLSMIGVLFAVDWIEEFQTPWALRLWARRSVRWSVYLAGIYSIVFFGNFGRVEFIYFQF